MRTPKLLYSSILGLIVLLATAVIIAFAVLANNQSDDTGTSMLLFDIGVYIAYALLLAAFVLALVFPLIKIITHLKASARTLISVGAVLLVFLISFLFSPANTGEFYDTHGVGPQLARMINAGLITTYISLIATIAVFIFAEISSSRKK